MKKRMTFAPWLLAIATASAAHAATPAKEKTTTLQWTMSLSAEGRITSLEAEGEGIAALRERLEPVIRGWEFVPGRVDGQPAVTRTRLAVDVILTPSADGGAYAVRINDARTGGAIADMKAPRLSRAAANELMRGSDRRGAAMVVVEVRYDAAGKVAEVIPAADSTVQSGPLLAVVRKSVSAWTFAPERVAESGVAGTVQVPICFAASSSLSEARRLMPPCRWTRPGTNATVEEGQALALDSSVQIKTDVTGSLL